MSKFLSIAIIVSVLVGLAGWFLPASVINLGGSTSDDWTVGGILSVTGSSALTGAATLSSTLSVTGEAKLGSLVAGGSITAVTATSTVTLTASQICHSSVITFTGQGSQVSATTTFPTTASLVADCLTANGDTRDLLFRNIGSAASNTIFKVASTTAETLLITEMTGADIDIAGGNSVFLNFLRVSSTAMVITVTELIDGD